MENLTRLRYLDVHGNKISPVDIENLAKKLKYCEIEK
jgi:internalin A